MRKFLIVYAKIGKRGEIMTTIQLKIPDEIARLISSLSQGEEEFVLEAIEEKIIRERSKAKLEETDRDKASRVLREAGLTSSIKFPNAKKLSDEERHRLGKLFSGEKPLGDYIDEDREARG